MLEQKLFHYHLKQREQDHLVINHQIQVLLQLIQMVLLLLETLVK